MPERDPLASTPR